MTQYTYNGDEQITITAQEFAIIKRAVEDGLAATVKVEYPEVFTKVNSKGEEASEEDITNGNFSLIVNPHATFSEANRKISYDGNKITASMLQADEILVQIHGRNIESGIAKEVVDKSKEAVNDEA